MEKSFQIVQQLVADFKANESAYLSSEYQEQHVREDFINKFFTALGWDVTHTQQKNPYEQEVKIENRVTMPGTQRRADYAFFIMPNYRDVKFFAEAKKPSRNLSNADDYYQAIRYAWNANTPIAILTDFEEFHVLDCRYKPDIKDSINRKLKQYHYTHYADEEKFKEIFYLFGREAVANGSLEKFAADLPKPRGKAIQGGLFKGGYKSVDEAFLEQLDEYRDTLAKAFKKENQELGGEELTEAVQRTIDRLVFIRFLEDKGIEEPQIIGLHENKSAWNSFITICKRFEPKYNGLIFKPHRILDGNKFNPPDDRDFADICGELADPTSPYDFDKIPISILGSIYERFLGKVVHATTKQAKVEDKPEVRKAGGVYYTPEYIVRYIVNETVGKLIEYKTPDEIAKLSFADIACGSGSFLIEVYSVLLEYHDRWYNANREKVKKDDVFEREGHLHLSLKKKKEILTNNVYGVDIDSQAIEVTQLSLYLKLLENVSMNETYQMGMFKETILPNLSKNIVCGNSLIGTDIGGLFESEETDKLKPMNYEDVFSEIMKRGGFDAIVGNPPYVRMEEFKDDVEYLSKKYKVYHKAADLYTYFIEKSLLSINKKGSIGFIVSNKWMRAEYGLPLRKLFYEKNIELVVDFEHQQVFKGATTYPCIIIFDKNENKDFFFSAIIKSLDFKSLSSYIDEHVFEISKTDLNLSGWVLAEKTKFKLIDKIKSVSNELTDTVNSKIYYGLKTGLNEAFIVDELKRNSFLKENIKCDVLLKPYLEGKDLSRYNTPSTKKYVILIPNGFTKQNLTKNQKGWDWFCDNFKPIATHLKNYESKAKARYDQGEYWWELRSCDYYDKFNIPKICWGNLSNEAPFCYDRNNYFVNAPACILPIENLFVLGCLNSKLLWWFLKDIAAGRAGGFIEAKPIYVQRLPIRKIDFNDANDKIRHDNIVKLVDQMLEAKQKLFTAKTDGEVNRLELQCTSLDRKIDEAVYELYGLTDEEIKIVEWRE